MCSSKTEKVTSTPSQFSQMVRLILESATFKDGPQAHRTASKIRRGQPINLYFDESLISEIEALHHQGVEEAVKAVTELKVIEPPKGLDWSDNRRAFMGGQMNVLVRILELVSSRDKIE